jgi:catalase
VKRSQALSLTARPGDGGIRTRKVAILIADGVDDVSVRSIKTALLEAGAVPRLVGPRIGAFKAASGAQIQADASLENEPGFLFDALVLPDGEAAVQTLAADGNTGEFVKNQYRHGKTIMAVGASIGMLGMFDIPGVLPGGDVDPGLISVSGNDELAAATLAFIAAVGKHKHTERDRDPPLV